MAALTQIVEAEAETAGRFVELLQREGEALNSADIDSLDTLVARKNDLAAELSSLAEQRNTLLAKSGFSNDRSGIEAWLGAHPASKSVRKTWSRLLALAGEARELNRLNGELIQLRMQHNSQALEILLGASRQTNLYGPDGQSAPQNNRRINDAA